MDWLSRLFDMMSVAGRLDLRCTFGAPWRVAFDRSKGGVIPYHIMLRGSATLDDPAPGGAPSAVLTAGDVAILLDGAAHVVRDGSNEPPVPPSAHEMLNVTIVENEGSAERMDILCGHFILPPPHDRLMHAYLPRRLIVRAGCADAAETTPSTGTLLAGIVSLMRAETLSDNLGGRAMLNGLQSVLFALSLRLASEAEPAPKGLLALAGSSRLAAALTAMLHDPAYPWTLSDLAERCNMSRATLVRHFDEKLGCSAIDLLKDIRMTAAANALRNSSLSTEAVAESVGYQSAPAFIKAFRDHTGMTPADWRRSVQAKA